MIQGVRTKALKVIPDERGRLMESLRSDDDIFIKFGQAYVTTAYPGVVKGWHYHKIQVDNFVPIKGMFKVVLYDDREGSSTRGQVNEFFIGVHNPLLLQIPVLVLHGFKAIGTAEAIMLNLPTEPYRHDAPDEYRVDPRSPAIPYDWALKER
ncbi:MAG TPA: dTDP-4-dehydrorhamnose 3,5-epimerase family protein [Candidatus Polarisedimenticolia bacterium]|nr:dTDP-4-dehydrorhamnose 3,5-epimerase family protein [Candidatus Polarisedimenticolia bacterium]